MELGQAHALTVTLTAAEHDQVKRAAAAVGQGPDDFVRTAVLAAAADPFIAALERAAETIAARDQHERIQHDFAR
ncbi:hypothetical protein [Streptomyces similanensis]